MADRVPVMPRWYGAVFVVAVLVGLLLMVPLGVALDGSGLGKLGLSARAARGTIWRGNLTGASFASIPLGDVTAAIAPLPLFTGVVRFKITDPLGERDISVDRGLNTSRIVIHRGKFDISEALAPLPARGLEIEDLDVQFNAKGCKSALGRARIALTTGFGGVRPGDALAGTVRCAGKDIGLDAASQSGAERIAVTFQQGRRYRLIMTVTGTTDTAELVRMGFRAGPQGMQLTIDGRL